MNLLRHITWEQPDYMWQYQLKYERAVIAQSEVGILGKAKVISLFIIPHVNSPYKTSIDVRLIFYNITRCYSNGEYCHVFAIAAGDILNIRAVT